ncbi:hypothetical protein ACE83Q_01025 [Dellaglioa sp. P0083]|uniref:hypothetical protein n=1 Tax=Dellaglioa kimchii TaxID=3344667 RepID=UPI0038D427AC
MSSKQRLCPICSTSYEKDAKLCSKCGFNLARKSFVNESIDIEERQRQVSQKRHNKRCPTYIFLFIALLSSAVIGCICSGYFTAQTTSTISIKSEDYSSQSDESTTSQNQASSSTVFSESTHKKYVISKTDMTKIKNLEQRLTITQQHIIAYMYWLEVSGQSLNSDGQKDNQDEFSADLIGEHRWALYKGSLIEVNYQYENHHYAFLMNHDMDPESPDTLDMLYKRYTSVPSYRKTYKKIQKEWRNYE